MSFFQKTTVEMKENQRYNKRTESVRKENKKAGGF